MKESEWNNKKYIDEQLQSALFMLKDAPIKESRVHVTNALTRMDEMEANK